MIIPYFCTSFGYHYKCQFLYGHKHSWIKTFIDKHMWMDVYINSFWVYCCFMLHVDLVSISVFIHSINKRSIYLFIYLFIHASSIHAFIYLSYSFILFIKVTILPCIYPLKSIVKSYLTHHLFIHLSTHLPIPLSTLQLIHNTNLTLCTRTNLYPHHRQHTNAFNNLSTLRITSISCPSTYSSTKLSIFYLSTHPALIIFILIFKIRSVSHITYL